MALWAQTVGGSVRTIGETLQVEGAREAVLYFTADTTYHYSGEEKDAYVERCLKRDLEDKMTDMSYNKADLCGDKEEWPALALWKN